MGRKDSLLELNDSEDVELSLDADELEARGLLSEEVIEGTYTGVKRAIMGARTSYNRGRYIYASQDLMPLFTAIMGGRNRRSQKLVWREMLYLYGRTRIVLLEVQNVVGHRTWMGCFVASDVAVGNEKLLHLICADPKNGMSYDYHNHGIGGFELKLVGAFPHTGACLDYREYLINTRLDTGWGSYNQLEIDSGVVKRVLGVELSGVDLRWLDAASRVKAYRIKDVVRILLGKWLSKSGVPRPDPLGAPES